jgi:hypothetical protein
MADQKNNKKAPQLTLEEYNKVKEKNAQSKLKLQFPLLIKLLLGVPITYFLFLVVYYLMHIRFATEH